MIPRNLRVWQPLIPNNSIGFYGPRFGIYPINKEILIEEYSLKRILRRTLMILWYLYFDIWVTIKTKIIYSPRTYSYPAARLSMFGEILVGFISCPTDNIIYTIVVPLGLCWGCRDTAELPACLHSRELTVSQPPLGKEPAHFWGEVPAATIMSRGSLPMVRTVHSSSTYAKLPEINYILNSNIGETITLCFN